MAEVRRRRRHRWGRDRREQLDGGHLILREASGGRPDQTRAGRGLGATRQLLTGPDPASRRVVIPTTFDVDEHVHEALRAGAPLRDAPADQLIHAIRVAAAGDALLAPSVTRRLIASFTRRESAAPSGVRPSGLAELTPREVEVLELLAEGLSNVEIRARLIVGEATVETHVARILLKLGVRDGVQAVIVAFRAGLVPLDR